MESIDLLRGNLSRSTERVLARIEEMRDFCFQAPTTRGGGHTLWLLGHLAYIEGLVIDEFMLGGDNPRRDWEKLFDGSEVSADPTAYPGFDEVLAICREQRARTMSVIARFDERDLDRRSACPPRGHEDTFGTYRLCLQFVADHWYMHRGQLAAARRAAAVDRMWF